MTRKSQKLRQTINFVEIDGIGTIRLEDDTLRDIQVVGYFQISRYKFMINRDVHTVDHFVVSEVSTGMRLTDYCYPDVESALNGVVPYIESKNVYFPTAVGDVLVKFQCNLERRNTTNLQTLAIDSLWIK